MKLKLLFLTFFISFIGYSQTISVSGVISTNTTWNVDTVKVTGDVTVANLKTLTINPGTYVEFQGYYKILVNGRMLAKGTVTDSITFAINDTTGFSNSSTTLGGWNTIQISTLSTLNDTTIFEYCKIQNSKLEAVFAYNGKVRIERCSFFDNYYAGVDFFYCPSISICRYCDFKNCGDAIGLAHSKSVISNNTIDNNLRGIKIFNAVVEIAFNIVTNSSVYGICAFQASPGSMIHDNNVSYNVIGIYLQDDTAEVFNNIVSYNSNPYTGGGISCESSRSFIHNNTISYNSAKGGSGIFISGGSSSLLMFNKIANNYSWATGCGFTDNGAGIFCLGSQALIINNLICNNTAESNGGGISSMDSSSVTLINNTIVNNKANNYNGGGGIAVLGNYGFFELKNNIIWGNDAPILSKEIFLSMSGVNMNTSFCDIADTLNSAGYVELIIRI